MEFGAVVSAIRLRAKNDPETGKYIEMYLYKASTWLKQADFYCSLGAC